MRFASLFAGIGGFDLGFERAGMQSALQVEINKNALNVLGRHWPAVPRRTDVKEIRGSDLGGIDLLCGGFPCQDLSVAGRRSGLAGQRSGLFYEVARILDEAAPEWVVLENVPGLLSSRGGRDMGAVLGTLADLGYGFSYRVLDARYFGVAQRRRRVFIVGHLGDWDGPREVLFEPEGVRGDSAPGRRPESVVAALSASGVGTCGADDNQGQAGHLIVQVPGLCVSKQRPAHAHRSDSETETFIPVSVALRGRDGGATAELGGPQAGTLRASQGGGDKPYVLTDRVRRLTPMECERLQGFPDGHTDSEPDSARYRMLGNAVAVPVVEWIGRRLVAVDSA